MVVSMGPYSSDKDFDDAGPINLDYKEKNGRGFYKYKDKAVIPMVNMKHPVDFAQIPDIFINLY